MQKQLSFAPTFERALGERLYPTRTGNAYMGIGEIWRVGERYRVISSQWFPVGTVLVLDRPIDIDLYPVNVEQTIAENGYTQQWLDAHEPAPALTLPLF